MKKKLVGTLLATALIFTQVAGVIAAPSTSTPPVTAAPTPTLTPEQAEVEEVKNEIKDTVEKEAAKVVTEVKIVGGAAGKYEAKMAVIDTTQPITKEVVTEATREVFANVEQTAPQVFNAIVEVNQIFSEYQGQLTVLTSVVSGLPGVPGLAADGKDLTKDELKALHETVKQLKKDVSKKLTDLVMVASEAMSEEEVAEVTKVMETKEPTSMPFDLSAIDGGEIDENGMNNITMENQNLTDEEHFDGTVLLLIDMETKTSKIVEPEVDYETKEMTFKTESLGIGVLMADKEAEEE